MVEVRYRGRLGNRLFQYCFGRILAEGLGYALGAEPIEGFIGTQESISGCVYDEPSVEILDREQVEPASLIADRSPRKIRVNAFVQRAEYYAPYRKRIRQWLRLAAPADVPGEHDLVLSIRLGDFIKGGRVLSPEYYFDVARRHGRGRIWIVTDEPDHPYLNAFAQLRPRYYNAGTLDAFGFLQSAHHLVLSASTFGWWAAYLSDAQTVYFPVLDRPCHWWSCKGPSIIDLRVDAPNYVFVHDVAFGKSFVT
jgi:hypothetical protein